MSNQIEDEAAKAVGIDTESLPRQGLFGGNRPEEVDETRKTGHQNYKLLDEEPRIKFKNDWGSEPEKMHARVTTAEYLANMATRDVVPDESRPDNVLRMFSRAQVRFMSDQTAFLHLKDLDKFVGDQHTFIYEMRMIMCLLDKGKVAAIQEQVIKTYVEALTAQGLL